MKTILIPIFQGSEAKNILRNGIFSILRARSDLNIVLLVPTEIKKNYFESEFSGKNITYMVVSHFHTSFVDSVFFYLKKNLLRTNTIDIKRRNALKSDGKYLKFVSEFLINRIFARRFFRKILRWIDQNMAVDRQSVDIFNSIAPDLLFTAHIFGDMEASLIKEAKRRGVLVVGMINSWDKITSRGMVRALPDKLLVHNEIIQLEALDHLDMDRKNVYVVGIPHYDIFFHKTITPKEVFYRDMGLDIHERILLFCPMGKTFSDVDEELINTLIQLKLDGFIPADLRIIVRCPPNDPIDLSGVIHRDLIIVEQPGVRFSSTRGIDWDMTPLDIQKLADSLFYTSVLICPPSSISIDAAVFDRPIINIRFKKHDSSGKNVNSYYEMDHYKNIVTTGGVRLVDDKEQLCYWINKYCDDPSIDREGRRLIVEQQCKYFDGSSGARVARLLVDFLNN